MSNVRQVTGDSSPVPVIIDKLCMNLVLDYTTKLYDDYDGVNDPVLYTKLALRMMPRPLLDFNPEIFSQVQTSRFNGTLMVVLSFLGCDRTLLILLIVSSKICKIQ